MEALDVLRGARGDVARDGVPARSRAEAAEARDARRLRAALLAAAAVLRAAALAAASGTAPTPLEDLREALEARDLPRAVKAGEAAVASEPSSPEANDLLGRAYGLTAEHAPLFDQIRFAKKARACFARAVELDPDDVAALSDLARYDMRAPGVLGGGRKKARALIERVQALALARGRVLAGELADIEKDPARAEAEFRAAIAADPRSDEGWSALSAFFVARRRFGDARLVWEEAAETGGGAALAAYGLGGVALASDEEVAEAAQRLRRVLERPAWSGAPGPAECHERLGALYAKLGRRPEAAAELEAALRLEPGRSDWRLRLARLER